MSQAGKQVTDQLARLIDRAAGRTPPLEPCLHKLSLDRYTDKTHYQREMQGLYGRKPLILCHETQLPNAGDSLVHDWFGLPLVTVRNKAGTVSTFMNVCRHRNTRLIDQPGLHTLKSMVCPYHQWTYGLDGELRNIPREHEDFVGLEKDQLGLVRIPTEVRHGLIWLQLTLDEEVDLDRHLAGIGDDLDYFGVDTAHFYTGNTREVNCNWKLIQDAFLDGYHVIRLHKNTVGPFFPDCLAVSEQVGPHIRSSVGRNEALQADDLAPEQWDPRIQATFSYCIFPNGIVIMHPDYTSLITLYPLSPDKTIFSHSMLLNEVPTTEKAKAHFDKSFKLIDQGVFQAEDIFVSESAQSGMRSGANTEMLLGCNELTMKQFHDSVDESISGVELKASGQY